MVSQNGHDDGPRIGALLRASRLRCGEEVADVARVLHIRLIYIEAIEEGRYDDLPGAAYAIGFIRAYADHLGLDSNEVVRRFKAETSGLDTSIELKFLSPIPESGIPRAAILFVGMVVAVLAYGGWYVSSTRDHFLTDLIPPLPERLAALLPIADGTDAQTPVAPPGPDEAPGGDAPQAGDAPRADTTADSGEPAGATPAVPEEAAPMAAAPQPVAPSADASTPIEVTPIEVTPVSEVAETTETPPMEEMPAPEVAGMAETPSMEAAPEVAGTAGTPSMEAAPAAPATPANGEMADGGAAIVPPVPEAAPEPEPAAQTVAEITETMPPPTTEPGEDPAAGEPSSADAAPIPVATITEAPERAAPAATPPAAAEAVAEVRRPAPTPPQPAAPESEASLATTGGTETPGPADDGGAIAEAQPPVASGGDAGDQVATLTEDVEQRPADDAATPAEGRESRILVRARMASWIQVRDDIGNRLLTTRLMRAGDTFRVPDRPGLKLLTGNAGALEILVDGETVPPLGPIGAVRRDVALDIERLREGTAAVE